MKAGIWIDGHKAYVVYLTDGREKIIRLESDVEDYHVHGGSAAPVPFGTHDAVSERRLLERKKHQLSKYFKRLIDQVKSCKAIYIFGPAEVKKGLRKEILADPVLKSRLKRVETSGIMTENQIIARVKRFFNQDENK